MRVYDVLATYFLVAGIGWANCSVEPTESLSSTNGAESRKVLRTAGYKEFLSGQYENAFACYIEALRDVQTKDPHNVLTVASDLNDIGILSEEMGRYNDAKKYYSQELEILKPLGDAASSELSEAYIQLGGLAVIQGSFVTAERDFRKAVALSTSGPGASRVRLVKALGVLARLYEEWGRYNDASQLISRARAKAEKGMPQTRAALIVILDTQAALLSESGKYSQAEKDWLKALQVAREAYGDNGLEYSAVLLHLGQLYTQIRDYSSARSVLEQAFQAEQKTKGADEMDLAIMTSALGNVYVQQHKLVNAEPLFGEAVHAMDVHCDSVPLACAAVRSYVGDFYMAKSEWAAAEVQYERALAIRQRALGPHPLVASSLYSMSRALRKLKRRKEAKKYRAEAAKIMALPANSRFNNDITIDVRAIRAGVN
jgi:tetratricopeptide (TPR) repeat protein